MLGLEWGEGEVRGEVAVLLIVAEDGGNLRMEVLGGDGQLWDRLDEGSSWGEHLMGEIGEEPELCFFNGGSILLATLAEWNGCRGGGNGNFEGEAETEFTSVAPIVGEHFSVLDMRCSRLCWLLAS